MEQMELRLSITLMPHSWAGDSAGEDSRCEYSPDVSSDVNTIPVNVKRNVAESGWGSAC